MGFFETVGRRVEKFKRTAEKAADERAAYRCRSCDARFDADADECPECGSTETVSTEAGE